MCGIAGAYQQPDGEHAARVMVECLAHRGPDDEGLLSFADEEVAVTLGHRRLSIIDLSHGHQPLVKEGLALSYNGELYNYRQLRAELAAGGAHFVTASDTEVVLESWRRWGPMCLSKFRGMFAFALFDKKSGSLFLARDQLGIKPLHYLLRKDGVVFSSELKALIAAFGDELRMDPATMVASMLYYWVPDQRCSIRGVQKLAPGTWAEFRPDGTHRVNRYWNIAEVATGAAAGPARNLGEVLEASVAAHLVADVPVSSFLSGGLDSSIVTVLAQRDLPDIDAYTITFRPEDHRLEAMPDDALYARKIARRFGIRLHEIQIAPDVVETLPRMVDILDEPIGDPAAINTLLMCEAAHDAGVKVVLSGMGADELFGGYRKHLACTVAARYRRLPGVVRGTTTRVVGRVPVAVGDAGSDTPGGPSAFSPSPNCPKKPPSAAATPSMTGASWPTLVDPDLESDVDDVIGEHLDIYDDNTLTDHVNRMCLADARLFLPGLNLAYTDRSSMAASIEVRLPFVDPVVFEAAFSLSSQQKVRGRTGKVALKEAALSWLPSEIVHRPKASFSAPLRAWISHDLRDVVDEVLLRGDLVSMGFLQHSAVSAMVVDDRSGREDRSKQIWQLLTLEFWYRRMRAAGVTL